VATCADDGVCTVLACAICLEEVPYDSSGLADVQDYVQHFCGLDCLAQWRRAAQSGGQKDDRLK
jgi:hypothetical protein